MLLENTMMFFIIIIGVVLKKKSMKHHSMHLSITQTAAKHTMTARLLMTLTGLHAKSLSLLLKWAKLK